MNYSPCLNMKLIIIHLKYYDTQIKRVFFLFTIKIYEYFLSLKSKIDNKNGIFSVEQFNFFFDGIVIRR